jgi:hypothetical protein
MAKKKSNILFHNKISEIPNSNLFSKKDKKRYKNYTKSDFTEENI